MEQLGFARFSVAGHDRDAHVGDRPALDHPDRVHKLAVLGFMPTGDALRRGDGAFGLVYWHWFCLAPPAPVPAAVIGHDPAGFFVPRDRSIFRPEALAENTCAMLTQGDRRTIW